ncbi:MAG: Recombination protein RecR [Candidatus Uhrbacteria bacterium GW2011_GWE2_40_58]|nr:MAG: Recombination protein RecR [Candidatus Uhrbacteria bacterium GW2011_GWF2_40_263]KKR67073.1 MAG: Recombination protein RecR [Candidatus Uhrbacteria bacterium GW2011_GWE2_40_58]OGL93988.1 MAG: recombination protein RecR [Candidatus Uhrbacteria bacterium RIFOXYA2_FULL_40_9]OGL97820.1 MAG: recombination protein RecR [Candidatus Uhrbacteria bacterium RIFOXYB2_FULL_41_18]HBK35235.1 recombination protein RecR [Candidatus Uhrbacteria bacterium]
MRRFPDPIQNLVSSFSRLPGVGPKTALRYVYSLLKQSKTDVEMMGVALQRLHQEIRICPNCFTYTEMEICDICQDQSRDHETICVIEESRDIATIEATDEYNGYYHVLGGVLNPLDGITPDTLRIRELIKKIQNDSRVKEILLALSPTIQGETTMMYLTKQLEPLNVRVTRLARGLPIGATLEYADEITLGDAIKERKASKS